MTKLAEPTRNQSPVVCATFPRSGHHYLVNLLSAVLHSKLVYCESYTTGIVDGANLIKDHDFELNRVADTSENYIIQIRHPLNAIISLFEQRLRMNVLSDTLADWELHAQREMAYWVNFYSKWVLGVAGSNAFQAVLIRYEDLVTNPSVPVTAAIRHLGFSPPPNLQNDSLQTALSQTASSGMRMDGHFIRKRQLRNVLSFRYFDKPFLEQLLAPVSPLDRASEWQYDHIGN